MIFCCSGQMSADDLKFEFGTLLSMNIYCTRFEWRICFGVQYNVCGSQDLYGGPPLSPGQSVTCMRSACEAF